MEKIFVIILLYITIINCQNKVQQKFHANDTFFLNYLFDLHSQPSLDDKYTIKRLGGLTPVVLLDSVIFPGIRVPDQKYLRVVSQNDTGFIPVWVLISKILKKQITDSLSKNKFTSQPQFKHMIGKTFCNDSGYPIEIKVSWPWNRIDNTNLELVDARSTSASQFTYILLAENTGRCRTIVDVKPVDLRKHSKNVNLWFDQCINEESKDTSSEIISLYKHKFDEKKNPLVIPEQAWKVDIVNKKIIDYNASLVRCGLWIPSANGP